VTGVQTCALPIFLLKIFPVVTMSLGASLYYTLGTVSVEAYVVSMVFVFLVGLAALAAILIMVGRATHQRLTELARYSSRMFATGLSIGSSYVILPLALRLFKEHFDADSAIRDLVLTLGASLNRCGSVMGVLIVTFVAAHYTGLAISWQQMLLLAFPVALIGFGSPGIQGGTLLVAMPVILYIVPSLNSERFMTVAVALFVGGTTFIQAAVNSVASGYVALLVNEAASGTRH
jgi:Na+/H+-dicarboxylate symporter